MNCGNKMQLLWYYSLENFINFAGTLQLSLFLKLLVTTELAPTIEFFPILTPGIITAFSPIQTLFSITTSPFEIKDLY